MSKLKKGIFIAGVVILICLLGLTGYILKPFFVTDVVKDVPEELKDRLLFYVPDRWEMTKLIEENVISKEDPYFLTGDKAFYKKYRYFGKEIEEYLVPYAYVIVKKDYNHVDIVHHPPEDYFYRYQEKYSFGLKPNSKWSIGCHAEIFVYEDGVLKEGKSGSYEYFTRLHMEAEMECNEGLWIAGKEHGTLLDSMKYEILDTWEKELDEHYVFSGADVKNAKENSFGMLERIALEIVSDSDSDFQSGGRILLRWEKGSNVIEENVPFQCEVVIKERYR